MDATVDLAKENAELKQQLLSQQQSLSSQQEHIKQLEELIRSFTQRQFGASSEKHPAQQTLFDEAEDTLAQEESEAANQKIEIPAHTRKRKKRVSIPEVFKREDIIHDLPETEKQCPHDGTALRCIGEETHEQLDIVPAKIKALRHIRKKYACPCCEQYIVTASKPKQPIEKSIASPGLLAHIAVCKYADALPLYRQASIFKRLGIELDKTSLANWMIRCGELIQPLLNRCQDHVLEQPIVHMDETPVQVLNEPGKTPQSVSYMWVMTTHAHCSPVVLFHYSPSRSQDTPKTLLADYHGALMVDGYSGYQGVCHTENITRLGCWAHARRKFVEAQKIQGKQKTGRVDQALAQIQKLYRVEQLIKDKPPDERYQMRQAQARPVIDELKQWLDKSLGQVPPKSAMGKALGYLHNQWESLIRYLDDGHYPIDNNRAENAIRPYVIGRKNWLFSTSQGGAKASANLYGLIETAKANGLEPYSYLKKVFAEIPNAKNVDDIDALLPWAVKDVVG